MLRLNGKNVYHVTQISNGRSIPSTCNSSNCLFLYPENIYAIWRITPENDAIIHNRMKVSIVDHH
jgi:hypothetical protein